MFGGVALVTGLVTSFASYFVGQAILSTHHINSTLSQPGVLRAVIGGGLFLAVCGLLSYGLGAVLRHTAGAITAAIGLLFVLTILSGFLPSSWAVHVDKWIPFNAGGAIWENVVRGQHVPPLDRVRGVLRLRGRRADRRADPVPPAGRVAALGGTEQCRGPGAIRVPGPQPPGRSNPPGGTPARERPGRCGPGQKAAGPAAGAARETAGPSIPSPAARRAERYSPSRQRGYDLAGRAGRPGAVVA